MPVILTEPGEWETWLAAIWSEAKSLQRPLPDGSLRVVLRGEKEDSGKSLPEATDPPVTQGCVRRPSYL